MVVLNDICVKCNSFKCNSMHFQHNFKNWTSGNNDIDKFIQDAQLSVHTYQDLVTIALEWIPYERLSNIEYIAKGGFGKVYKAKWNDGRINNWNDYDQNWNRSVNYQHMMVALKSLNNSKNVTLEFLNEV
jgi:hypothetical protein